MLTLRYHSSTTIPVEAECITPENLAEKSLEEIRRLPVQHGNKQELLGDYFEVSGDPSDLKIHLEGDCSRVKWLGANMTRGTLTVHGPAGMHVGAEMRGGEITVLGNASDWVGAEMRGGKIEIHGEAGHLVGAGYRGSRIGMRGGSILVRGKAGNEVGSGMRRGWITIGGETGDFIGVGLIAGTIFALGQTGLRPGAGMKRGTLLLGHSPVELLPTFRRACELDPLFLRLYWKQLSDWNFPGIEPFRGGSYQRFSGDLVNYGKGEILVRQGA